MSNSPAFADSQHTPTDYAALGLHNASPFQWRLEPVASPVEIIKPARILKTDEERREQSRLQMAAAREIKRIEEGRTVIRRRSKEQLEADFKARNRKWQADNRGTEKGKATKAKSNAKYRAKMQSIPSQDVLVHDSKAKTGQAGHAFRTV